MQSFLIKLDRLAAWTLLIGFLLYFISGYGMTKGIIDPAWADRVHLSYLTYIIVVAFVIHTSFAVSLAFVRWGVNKNFSVFIMTVFYLLFILGFIYVDRYYVKPAPTPIIKSTSAPIQIPTSISTVKTFTLTQLAQYNGKNGAPAYVAVDGNVYDLTSIFVSGQHFSHYAGTELTNAFYSYHAKKVLAKYPIVGTLIK